MMNTTIIVGAGATLAAALPKKPRRSLHPPLDATFFELCSLSGYRGQRVVRGFMNKQFGIDPFQEAKGMEEVFNYIYTDAFSGNPSDGCLDAYWALIGLYRAALSNTTNPLKGNSRSGIGQLIRCLYQHNAERNLSIITFNQDILIEKSIEYTKSLQKYSSIPWSIDKAYGVAFGNIFGVTNNPNPFLVGEDDSIKILKMHGSLNWVYRVRSGTDPKNSLRQPGGQLNCINDSTIWPSLIQQVRGSKRNYDLIPLVVPPIYEKSARYQQILDPVWSHAKDVLKETEELIVFGYSFPEADFASKSLFRQCLHNNKSMKTLHVIDINPAVAAKITDILKISSCHFYNSISCFQDVYMDEN